MTTWQANVLWLDPKMRRVYLSREYSRNNYRYLVAQGGWHFKTSETAKETAMFKHIAIAAVTLSLSSPLYAKDRPKDKVTCEIDTIRQGHRVRLDPKDYSARQAVTIVTVVNKTGGNVFAVCGLETVEESK